MTTDTPVTLTPTRLHGEHALALRREVSDLLACGVESVVLDLINVKQLDANGLAVIAWCIDKVGRRGRFSVVNPQSAVSSLLAKTRLDKSLRARTAF